MNAKEPVEIPKYEVFTILKLISRTRKKTNDPFSDAIMFSIQDINLVCPRVEVDEYVWEGIEVKKSIGKGLGVFATASLKRGFSFLYGGVVIPKKERVKREKMGNKNEYVVTVESGDALDGNPDLYDKNLPKFGWIGALMNEPSGKEHVNCIFLEYHRDLSGILDSAIDGLPTYLKTAVIVLVVCIKSIGVGEELLVDYGISEITRHRVYGYSHSRKRLRSDETIDKEAIEAKRKLRHEASIVILSKAKRGMKRKRCVFY